LISIDSIEGLAVLEEATSFSMCGISGLMPDSNSDDRVCNVSQWQLN